MRLVPAIGSIGNQRTTHRAGIKENRAGVPRDVARVVAFLASEEAG
jgi:NAD(P)-dependent dehydrogenase (short-subunit alcohol dehydrogenase family)